MIKVLLNSIKISNC